MSITEPEDAARAAKRIGQTAASRVRDLALELHETGVTLHAEDVRPDAVADPEWSIRVVEHLDADEELEPVRVKVVGVLQGAPTQAATEDSRS